MVVLSVKLHILFGAFLLLSPGINSFSEGLHEIKPEGKHSVCQNTIWKEKEHEGYRVVIAHQNDFLAAGSGGRIEWISSSGQITRSEEFPGEVFNALLSDNQTLVAAGNHGTILVSKEGGRWQKMDSGTRMNLNTLALFKGMVIAGADGGNIAWSDLNRPFHMISLPVNGNVVSVSAGATACFGVTDEGEIIRSENGMSWNIFDFNSVYSDYYGKCSFTKVLATENLIAVAGIRSDGSPVLFFSHLGEVWTERHLIYKDDQGDYGFLTDIPNDIFFDEPGDQFFLICNKGKIMVLPSCTQCNELRTVAGVDLTGIAGNENTLLIAGEHFVFKTLNLR